MKIDNKIKIRDFEKTLDSFFDLSGEKISMLKDTWDRGSGAPVFTVDGRYGTRGWTEWTQGFQYGEALYQFDATGDSSFLEYGRSSTLEEMAAHLSHTGVHDHGFNNVSTYGNLLRLMKEGRIPEEKWEAEFYRLALKISGAVQASRWTALPEDLGYVYSFNGPHSLFSDTIRSMRVMALSHLLGHRLKGEQDETISLLKRLFQHAVASSRYNVYFGDGRDSYDVRGRVVHESVFNVSNGSYRCPSSQQGYSPHTTWTRGLAWILCGYPEELEFLDFLSEEEKKGRSLIGEDDLPRGFSLEKLKELFVETACAAADFYLEETAEDGIPYWDSGAPGLEKLGNYRERKSDPFNHYEPVDSSAAVIAAQGLLRLGRYLNGSCTGSSDAGRRYFQAGLTVSRTLFDDPYLSRDSGHQGILLHSVYHRPAGWDFIPPGKSQPCGESSMWGDYHCIELAVYLKRLFEGGPYLRFFNI